MPHLSVSTWSVHRTLGDPAYFGPDQPHISGSSPSQPAQCSLMELPARLAAFGIHTLELCHFHLPSSQPAYLQEFKQALKQSNITLHALLIDAGDLTHPQQGERDEKWVAEWINHAGKLGAKTARVIAGKQPPSDDTLNRSAAALHRLVTVAEANGVKLVTENWLGLLPTAKEVLWLLDKLDGKLGFKMDFGNWSGSAKYDNLAQVAPFAESCHSKAHFNAPYEIDSIDYTRCLSIAQHAGFAGVHTLIYEDGDPNASDEWRGLAIEREVVQAYL